MDFTTDMCLDDEQLFPELSDVHMYDNDVNQFDLKKSPGHESVYSDMTDDAGPSPSGEGPLIDFEALLRENGLEVRGSELICLPEIEEPVEEPIEAPANVQVEAEGSEAPSSPALSLSDVESYTAPSPAPSSGRRTRSITRVRVAPAPLSPVREAEDEDPKRNKAAVQAKLNREKKKAYISSLEQKNEELEKENSDLKDNNERLNNENESLLEEVTYLKSVLANQSTLSNLLQNIPNVEGVSLTTSFNDKRKRSTDHDHDYDAPPSKRSRSAASEGGGVCLHVAGDKQVSLEFCRSCASMAGQGPSSKKS